MTARTAVLERANANTSSQNTDSNHSSPLRGRRTHTSYHPSDSNNSNIRGTWTGKFFVITGLSPDQFPPSPPAVNGAKTSQYASPTKSINSRPANGSAKPASRARNPRATLKRKRSSIHDSFPPSQDGDNTPSDPSQRNSRAGSGSDKDDDDQDSISGDQHAAETNVQAQSEAPVRRKRRRRGQRLLEQSLAQSRPPSPKLPLITEELDTLLQIDLPDPFLSRTPSPDPDDPNDEASAIYRSLFEPMTKADVFVTALTKFNPAQRRTDNLFQLAANTAAALRVWQDEYLEIDRRTAPHAPIPRKPATGNRQPLSPTLFEDQKEADIYDYIFDPKKLGHQNPVAQKVIRDASGRELRHRAIKGRVTADSQLVNTINAMSDDDTGRGSRTRKPVSKYDGVAADGRRRKRNIGQLSETIETDAPAKRGRWGGRGRGGRGRGGRGAALMAKRIREMREASAMTATSASAEDDSASENGAYDTYSREASIAPAQEALSPGQMEFDDAHGDEGGTSSKRKGRPKGSKNLHVRSDKGIPKGPRVPKAASGPAQSTSPSRTSSQPAHTATSSAKGSASQTSRTNASGKAAPKSEKRSESMTAWWARRKAAAAEAKRQAAEAAGQSAPAVDSSRKPEKAMDKSDTKSPAASHQYATTNTRASPTPLQPLVPAGSPYTASQRFPSGPPSQAPPPMPHHQQHAQVPSHYAQTSPLPPYAAPAPPPQVQYHSPHRQPAYPLPPMPAASPQNHHAFPHQDPKLGTSGPTYYHDPRYDPSRDRDVFREPHGYGYSAPVPNAGGYISYLPPGGFPPPGQHGPLGPRHPSGGRDRDRDGSGRGRGRGRGRGGY